MATVATPTGYVVTDADLDDLLKRRPGIALNRIHSDRSIAMERCKGATDRVIPASLVSENLDDFICRTYQDYDILARKMTAEFTAPICVGDTVSFTVKEEKKRGALCFAQFEVWKNGTTPVQTYEVTMLLITG